MTLPWCVYFVYAGGDAPGASPRAPTWIRFVIAGQSRQIPTSAAREAAEGFLRLAAGGGTPQADTARAIAAELHNLADHLDNNGRNES